jgi:4-amino-4-deoxy-L-arabinose transferase-like glycosyltransferase
MSAAGSTDVGLREGVARDRRRAALLAPTWRRAPRWVLDQIGRVPSAGRACLVIAFVNAAIWGFVVPPFQVPDEVAHFGYAQYLAETGKPPPQAVAPPYSPEEQTTLEALSFFTTIGRPSLHGVLTNQEDRFLRQVIAANSNPLGPGGITSVTNQPPLYYALEAVPYWLSPSSNILTRLFLMRLLSALMAAFTVLGVFMFLRELFPRTNWGWPVGALIVAFQPTFDFIAAGVHADNLLFLASTWLLFLLLRTYRRGLTLRRGVAIGAATAVGLLSKLTFIALTPGIALAVLLLVWLAWRDDRRTAILAGLATVLAAGVPFGIYALLNETAWNRGGPTAGGIAAATANVIVGGHPVGLNESLDYIWQIYLPRLGFMHHRYFARYPGWELWLNGAIGHFGWLDYTFPRWVYDLGRWVFYGLSGLAFVSLYRLRRRARPLLPIFICFGVMALGLLGAIGYTGIRYKFSAGHQFEQARYLFPFIAFWGAFVVLAAKAAGRRWAPVLAGVLVVAAMAHGLFAETLTISRYYG